MCCERNRPEVVIAVLPSLAAPTQCAGEEMTETTKNTKNTKRISPGFSFVAFVVFVVSRFASLAGASG
jgi:hypothetical protein